MKREILIIMILYTGFACFAQRGPDKRPSELRLTASDRDRFLIVFGGYEYASEGAVLVLTGIEPGNYPITVVRERRGRYGGIEKVTGTTIVSIPPNAVVSGEIINGTAIRIINSIPRAVPQPGQTQVAANSTYSPPTPIYGEEFAILKRQLLRIAYDRDRANAVLDAVYLHYFYSWQVADLLGILSNEGVRLSIAKEAYAKTVDQEKYGVVFDRLYLESSKRELSDYTGMSFGQVPPRRY